MKPCARSRSRSDARLVVPFVALAVLSGWTGGCKEHGTEIVFVIESPLGVPGDVNRLELAVGAAANDLGEEDYWFVERLKLGPQKTDDVAGFPVRYVVRAGSRYSGQVWMTATAFKDAARVVAGSGGAEFRSGEAVEVHIMLPAGISCRSSEVVCEGACVDLQGDKNHCGWCANVCGPQEPCVWGKCECVGGRTRCGQECVDVQRDPFHCGDCGKRCAGGSVCSAGSCMAECPGGFTDCGGSCVNTTSDRWHCGGCGVVCPEGQSCVAGSCSETCGPRLPYGDCDPLLNCVCAEGYKCDLAGWEMIGDQEFRGHFGPEMCVEASGSALEGDTCRGIHDCAAGLACVFNANGDGESRCMRWCLLDAPDCADGNPCVMMWGQEVYGVCRTGRYDFDYICNNIDDDGNGVVDDLVDFMRDAANCGSCGTKCPTGYECIAAVCYACDPEPLLGGECHLTTGCGCAYYDHCILFEQWPNELREICVPITGWLTEYSLCHPLIADCEPGLLCAPVPWAEDQAFCVRPCITAADCRGGASCEPTGGVLGEYGVCLAGTAEGTVGSPCRTADDCTALDRMGRECLRRNPGTGAPLPGGYCSQQCTVGARGCPRGSTCELLGLGGQWCLRDCATDLECRFWDGYSCGPVGTSMHCWAGRVEPVAP